MRSTTRGRLAMCRRVSLQAGAVPIFLDVLEVDAAFGAVRLSGDRMDGLVARWSAWRAIREIHGQLRRAAGSAE